MPALTRSGVPDCPHPDQAGDRFHVPPPVPPVLRARITQQSPTNLPILHVRYVPRMNAWLSVSADAPRLGTAARTAGTPATSTTPGATATMPTASASVAAKTIFDRRSLRTFAVETQPGMGSTDSVRVDTVQLLQQIFDAPAGVLLAEHQLKDLGQIATIARVVHGGAAPNSQPAPRTLAYDNIGKPGGRTWYVRWKLSRASDRGGWVVQHVVADVPSAHVHFNYWEAWRVPAHSSHTIFYGKFLYDDDFDVGGRHVVAHTSAAFYEGLDLPSSFRSNNPATGAHLLRSTTVDPHLPADEATDLVERTWVR